MRHVELHLVVGRVRLVLAHVAQHAGAAQRRPAQSEGQRLRSADDADVLGALQPDPVVRQQLLVLDDFRVHDLAELEDLLVPAGRHLQRQPADAHRVVGEPCAAELLEEIENQLALAERVEEHRHRADVHRVRAEPQAVAGDALQLAEHRAHVPRAPRHLDRHQLLDRLAVADVVGRGRDVVHPVGEQDDLRPVAVLAQLLDAAVQVADDDVRVDDLLAVESQHHPEHAVRARMLRTHVDHEFVGVEHRAVVDSRGCGHAQGSEPGIRDSGIGLLDVRFFSRLTELQPVERILHQQLARSLERIVLPLRDTPASPPASGCGAGPGGP